MRIPSWLSNCPVAHRGLHDESPARPENSLAACEAAIAAGYAIEIDVQLDGDNEVVVFHDHDLDRLTGRPGDIATAKGTERKALRLLGGDEPVPSLTDLLRQIDGRAPLLIEIKASRQDTGALEEKIATAIDSYAGEFALQSFNPYSLAWFRVHRPTYCRGQIAWNFNARGDTSLPAWRRYAQRRLWLNFISKPDFIAYDIDALPYAPVTKARAHGMPVLCWTVKTKKQLETARQHTDNIIFEGIEL